VWVDVDWSRAPAGRAAGAIRIVGAGDEVVVTVVDVAGLRPGTNAPHLDYRMYLFTPGTVTVHLTLGAALNIAPDRGVRVAVSFDDEPAQVITVGWWIRPWCSSGWPSTHRPPALNQPTSPESWQAQ
jgi:hypothetical protein